MNISIALTLGGVMAILFGVILGYIIRLIVAVSKRGSMELEIKKILLGAKENAQKILEDAEREISVRKEELRKEEKEDELRLKKIEERLIKREEFLDNRQLDLEKEADEIKEREAKLEKTREQLMRERDRAREDLERIGEYSRDEARAELVKRVERESAEDVLARIKKLEHEGDHRISEKAQGILAAAIQRLAVTSGTEMTASTVAIPSDEIKGKIIGKEGRNIRAFERAAGVDVIIDDTPGTITVSSFDPVRREIASLALAELIADGRVQPAKIEQSIEHAKERVAQTIKERGEKAAYECGIFDLDPRLLALLGRLHYRTSFGQNVLEHSLEMAHIAGIIAAELGANIAHAKAGALLHDIGKAVDHEVQGTHVEIGRRILQKFEVDEGIIKAMQSHHEEYPYETVESIIVQAADAISGGRPGARRDSADRYIKRLDELERIATTFPGVEKAYAIQAGRELRIFVKPEVVDDLSARALARDIALRVEQELKYPGEIKVAVIRETRAIEYAR